MVKVSEYHRQHCNLTQLFLMLVFVTILQVTKLYNQTQFCLSNASLYCHTECLSLNPMLQLLVFEPCQFEEVQTTSI